MCREEMGMRYKVVYKILFMNWPLAFTCLYCKWPGRAWPVFAGRSWPRISAQLGRFGEMKEGSEAAALVGDSGLRAAASEWICRMMDAGWEALTPFCGGYPDRLSERLAANAPPLLWVKGDRLAEAYGWCSVVGSRRLSVPESRFAFGSGEALAGLGFAVVSGGAQGADFQGVAGSVASGGYGAHVLPGGEPRHRKIASALVSEAPWEKEFDRVSALRRNRWIYAMSEISVVCASRFRVGGSWHGAVTARREKLGRVIVFAPAGGASEGNAALKCAGFEAVGSVEQLKEVVNAHGMTGAREGDQARLAV